VKGSKVTNKRLDRLGAPAVECAPMTTAVQAQNVPATQGVECWFEYVRDQAERASGVKRTIRSADDPRWDDELTREPFDDVRGYLSVRNVTRVQGEPVRAPCVRGFVTGANVARQTMRDFETLAESGSKTPWDTDRHFRDMAAQAEAAQREGRAQELDLLREVLRQTLEGRSA
jgi:hypothetical protein